MIDTSANQPNSLEEQLRVTQERFELAMRGANDGIWDWDLATNEVYYSPRWKAMLGYGNDEIESRFESWQTLTHPDDVPGALEAVAAHLSGETEFYQVEFRMRHKDGSYRWILARGLSLRDGSGKPYRMAGSHTDITDKKRAEEDLRQSERRFRTMFEQSPLATMTFAPNGTLLRVNRAWEQLWAVTQADIPDYNPFNDEQLREQGVRGYIERGFAGETVVIPPIRYEPDRTMPDVTDVQYRWIRAYIYPVKDERGEIREVVFLNEDITEQKLVEEDLERRVRERTRELTLMLEISQSVSSTLELRPLLNVIVDGLQRVVHYDGAGLLLLEGDELAFYDRQGVGLIEEVANRRIPIESIQPSWDVYAQGRPIIIDDVRGDTLYASLWRIAAGPLAEGAFAAVRGWMGVPLLFQGRVLGLLTLSSRQTHGFTEQQAEVALAIARQAAIAIENARLYEQAQQWAATEERARLARELHDSVTQALFSMTLHASTTRMQLAREGIDPASPLAMSVQKLSDLTRSALAEMRALLFELRPNALREEGLVAALRKQGAGLAAREDLRIDVTVPEARLGLDPVVEEQLYRISQEALHNVVKHARASHVQIWLREANGDVSLEIRDDGLGFDPQAERPGHIGLRTMRERAGRIGGELRIDSAPNAGTSLAVTVPHAV